jgi:hypothetical protein
MNSFLVAIVLKTVAAEPSPVPFSTSNTDGMPYESDWNLFVSLHQQAVKDSTMQQQRADLAKYVNDQVSAALSEIHDNLQNLGIEGFDTVWPGDGFNGVAYGGLYAVLVQLEKAGVSRVGKRMGASGGAASTILTMANIESFLIFYQVYQLYYQGHPERILAEAFRDTSVTSAIYAEATKDPSSFKRAQLDALIVSKCSSSGNTIFRGFRTLTQLVAAGYSSGDVSLGGFALGTIVPGTDVGHCADGGHVTVFPAEVASKNFGLLLYNTPVVSTSHPTGSSIDKLFRAGVDDAIAALKSSNLRSAALKSGNLRSEVAGGSIVGALPGPSGIVTAKEYSEQIGGVTDARDINLAP